MRDPRIDPRPGDILNHTDNLRARMVVEVNGNDIVYRTVGKNGLGAKRQCWISTWREWARKATPGASAASTD